MKWPTSLQAIMLMLVTLAGSELHTISQKLSRASSDDGLDGPVTAFKKMNHLDGSYQFGYDTGADGPQSFREEQRTADGEVAGRYGYVDKNGLLRVTEYVAGRGGYRSAETVRYPVNPAAMKLYMLPNRPDHPNIGGVPVWTDDSLPEILAEIQRNQEIGNQEIGNQEIEQD